jgi:hypothetical protein
MMSLSFFVYKGFISFMYIDIYQLLVFGPNPIADLFPPIISCSKNSHISL